MNGIPPSILRFVPAPQEGEKDVYELPQEMQKACDYVKSRI